MRMQHRNRAHLDLDDDPLWYKDAIIYEIHVKAYCDSNHDGTGDFKGLTEKLDYLQDLGITAVWLLPFYQSPLKDDGYDIADYTSIHPTYGTMKDFKIFLREAHRRGLRVITELVLNHTSDQHRWFQRSRRAKPGSYWRNFYVWSDTPDRYKETRVIFKDFESSNWTWDHIAKSYYWHRFYSHQPDLNYDNPEVQKAMVRIVDFWLDQGVNGLRLDAVPYLYEREGTNCENLPETYEFLKKLRTHVDGRYKNRMLLAEANQWPEDAAAYFGNGDECHMAFHFPLMPRLFMALRMEDRFPIVDILEQTPPIPDSCQWALFLRNHDELTLEMVTDEERDYMYRVYAQDPQMRINLGIRRRLAPLLGNHRRRIELINGLLFSIPGTPLLYYGDEIGMGDNIYLGDRNGVRTPMQWSGDRNAGFSRANPQQLYLPIILDPEYHYEAINVEVQQNNPYSAMWWMKRLIALRKRFKAFGRGAIRFLHPENRKVIAFIRSYKEEQILVVANLSRFIQYAEIDLSFLQGMIPLELFGRTAFPPIGEQPYFITLGPRDFYWFALEPQRLVLEPIPGTSLTSTLPLVVVEEAFGEIFQDKVKTTLESLLSIYLPKCRWFGSKARSIKSAKLQEVIPAANQSLVAYITLVMVEYTEQESEVYVIPLTYASGNRADKVLHDHGHAALARLRLKETGEEGILYDALVDKEFSQFLLETIIRHRRLRGLEGELITKLTRTPRDLRGTAGEPLEPSILKIEQSNTSVVYGNRFILKVIRRLDYGINPDLEIGRFLTERRFPHIPSVAGAIEYQKSREEPRTLAILHSFIRNEGDAWAYTQDALSHYYELVLTNLARIKTIPVPKIALTDLIDENPPLEISEMIGTYLDAIMLLGQRTAELHVTLASAPNEPPFASEPFSRLYQRSLYQSMRSLSLQVFRLLRQRIKNMPEPVSSEAQSILDQEEDILARFRAITDQKITAMRIRCHGDYHLGQVLYTGKDFMIIDFEGEPARSISERRIKRSPLRDVAGMLRSFHYAAYSAQFAQEARGLVHPENRPDIESWTSLWYLWVCVFFLKAYLEVAAQGDFLPRTSEELRTLLDIYLLEKAVYELGYELNNRPDWVKIPLRGIQQLLQTKS